MEQNHSNALPLWNPRPSFRTAIGPAPRLLLVHDGKPHGNVAAIAACLEATMPERGHQRENLRRQQQCRNSVPWLGQVLAGQWLRVTCARQSPLAGRDSSEKLEPKPQIPLRIALGFLTLPAKCAFSKVEATVARDGHLRLWGLRPKTGGGGPLRGWAWCTRPPKAQGASGGCVDCLARRMEEPPVPAAQRRAGASRFGRFGCAHCTSVGGADQWSSSSAEQA